GEAQGDVEAGEYAAADPHADHGLGHEPCREHTLVTQGLEPEPFGGERDQIEEQQQEGEQDDQHDQAQATPPTRRQTGYAQRSGHEGRLTQERGCGLRLDEHQALSDGTVHRSTFGAYRRNSRGAVAACLVATMTASSASRTPTRASRTWPSASAWKVKMSCDGRSACGFEIGRAHV